jgi:signal transduction histidine kinase
MARALVLELRPDGWTVRAGADLDRPPLYLVDERDRRVALRAYLDVRAGRRTERTLDLRLIAEERVLECTFVRLAADATDATDAVVLYGLDVTDVRARQNWVLATVSHELRGPLTAVQSFVELLADPMLGPLNQRQLEACAVVARNTRRLLVLVDDLLVLAKLERGGLRLRRCRVDLDRLIGDAVEDCRPEADSRGITLTCAAPAAGEPELVADVSRLRQVVDNLVHNALKFSTAGSTVRVSAGRDVGRWIVEVADQGIGIPSESLQLITNGFARGANAVGVPGSGIGLAVCRELVELHGGTLDIRSTVDVGTTVRVSLPDKGGTS